MTNAKNVPSDLDNLNALEPHLDGNRLRTFADQAVRMVLVRYNSEPSRRLDATESGAVFWDNADGGVSIGEIQWGEGTDRVSPYSDADRKPIVDQPHTYLGDYHTHTAVSINWTAHFPSAEDLQFESVLCDYWHLEQPVPGHESLKRAPRFQLVQSLWFGDVFVIEQAQSRITYTSPETQNADIGNMMMPFRVRTAQYDDELGDYDPDTSHDDFLRIAKRWVDDANIILGKRCQIRLIPNDEFRHESDPGDDE